MDAHQPEIIAHICIGRVDAKQVLKAIGGYFKLSLLGQNNSQAIARAGMAWQQLNRLAIAAFRFREFTLSLANRTQETPGIGMTRLNLEDLLVKLFRLRIAARLMLLPSLIENIRGACHINCSQRLTFARRQQRARQRHPRRRAGSGEIAAPSDTRVYHRGQSASANPKRMATRSMSAHPWPRPGEPPQCPPQVPHPDS